MIIIPFALNDQEYNVFVALHPDNILRMQRYDPAQVQMDFPEFCNMRLKTVIIGFAKDSDVEQVMRFIRPGNQIGAALQFLSRGFEFKPEAGDYDGPTMSLRDKGEPKQ